MGCVTARATAVYRAATALPRRRRDFQVLHQPPVQGDCVRQAMAATLEVVMHRTLVRKRQPQLRWPEAALSNAFVRNVAKAGRHCDGHRG